MMIKAKLIQSVNFNKVSVFEHLNISLLCSPPQWSSAKRSFRKDEKDLTLILMQITPFSKMQLVFLIQIPKFSVVFFSLGSVELTRI